MTSGHSGAVRPSCLTRPPSIDGSFGGNQMWTSTPLMQNCGCGIIAGLDAVLRYEGISTLTMDEYLKRFDDAARYLKPIVLPGSPENPKSFGVSTLGFKSGIKKLAASRGIPVKAKGFIFDYETKVKKYLEMGVPVVSLIAAPLNNVSIVNCNGAGSNIGFHWVTCTGIDDRYLEVSSWGGLHRIELSDLDRASAGVRFYAVLPL
ncbi:MAG: hypothetical protein IJ819_05850 [Clostridiales bacterium]|nr:hypothetical protein [Clostridiales bacterium]